MTLSTQHTQHADVSFDGGDLDCGNGLLLLIRKHIDPLDRGGLLEIRSTEISVDEDLPAWCRMTGNELVSFTKQDKQRSFLVAKGRLAERKASAASTPVVKSGAALVEVKPLLVFPAPAPAPVIRPLSVMGIGSWPRPRWMLQAVHEHMEGRLDEAAFHFEAPSAN